MRSARSASGNRPRADYPFGVFTGLVREVGTVASFEDGRLRVESSLAAAIGDSVAIAGVCLTVVDGDRRTLAFDAVPETLERTTLGRLVAGSAVNLEPALRAGEPLGGHYVQGHVDGVGAVRSTGDPVWIDTPSDLLRYVVEKGSITLDGISLTVAAVDDATATVEIAVIPHTLAVTTLGPKAPGDPVNIEVDVLAKHVERLLATRER